MPRVKAMLEAGPLDGVAVGEAVEVEVGVEGGYLRRVRLRHHLPRQLLLLRRVAMLETRRWSSSCSCVSHRVAAFAFPRRSRGCWRSTSGRV